jgi:hypothetical protein
MTTSNDRTDTDVHDRLDRLESLVEQQQDRIEQQQETICEQRERIADLEGDDPAGRAADESECGADDQQPAAVNRRTALKAGGLLAALGLGVGAGTASADPQGQVGTSSDPLQALYTAELNGPVTSDQALTDLTGSGLSVSDGSLDASGASAWTEADADDLLEPKSTRTGIDVADIQTEKLYGNSGTVTVQDALDLNGNNLTSTSAGTDFLVDIDALGSSDEEDFALEIQDTNTLGTTVRWRRDPAPASAFEVETEQGGTTNTRLRLDDDGHLEVYGDIINASDSGTFTIAAFSGDLLLNADEDLILDPNDNVDLFANDLEDGGTTVWDSGNEYVPQDQLENDSVTVSAGTGLDGGGSASLGGSTTLNVASDGIGPTELANAQFREPTTKTLSPGFGSWTEVDANRPAFLEVDVRIFAKNSSSGSADGIVDLSIDESGGTSANITYTMRIASNTLVSDPSGDFERRFRSVYVPAGGQFQLKDRSSPKNLANEIETVRAIVG